MLGILLTIIHIIVCFVLIMVVLLQTGKRADLAGAFGGGGSQTAFGARGAATVLSRMTTVCAVVFMITSLSLALLKTSERSGSSLPLEGAPAAPASPVPSAPSPAAPAGITQTPDSKQGATPPSPAPAAPGDPAPSVPPSGDAPAGSGGN